MNLISLSVSQRLDFSVRKGSEEKLEVNNYCLNGVLKRSWRRFAFNSPIPDMEAFSFLIQVQFRIKFQWYLEISPPPDREELRFEFSVYLFLFLQWLVWKTSNRYSFSELYRSYWSKTNRINPTQWSMTLKTVFVADIKLSRNNLIG